MADDKAPVQDALVIRGAPGKHALLALGSLAFVVVGVLMLTVPPPPDWLPALAAVGGVLSLLLGLAGLGTVAYAATRPIMLLYPDRLVDARRQLTIAFAEIREVAVVSMPGVGGFFARWLSPQWLLLYLHDPAKHAALERLSKRSGLSDANLTLDLSLVSAADFARTHAFICARLRPAGQIATAGARPAESTLAGAAAAANYTDFLAQVGGYFAEVLAAHDFSLVDCLCLHDDRECTAMYQSPRQRLLLERSDGAFHVLLGARTAPFPNGSYLDAAGAQGWYALHLLVEFTGGARVYTAARVQEIQRGARDPYAFEAELLTGHAEQLLPMFEPGQEATWRTAFQQWFGRATRQGRRTHGFHRSGAHTA